MPASADANESRRKRDFSLRECGIPADRLRPGVKPSGRQCTSADLDGGAGDCPGADLRAITPVRFSAFISSSASLGMRTIEHTRGSPLGCVGMIEAGRFAYRARVGVSRV